MHATSAHNTLAAPSGQKAAVRIFEQGRILMGQIADGSVMPLVPLGNPVFTLSENPGVRITFTVTGDRATKLTLAESGRTVEAPREP
ncbi:MAG: hypothetical protein ABR499_18800 [Gemmatimonadaceae bacterium]